MARRARIVSPGDPHLVVQRTPLGRLAFFDDVDRQAFVDALAASADPDIALHAYALEEDGFQLVATPAGSEGLRRCLQRVGRRYVALFNRRHGLSGGLWQGRFRAAPLEADPYLLLAIRAVEQAPVRSGLVTQATDWPWSSAAAHIGRRSSAFLRDHEALWKLGNTPFEREARYQDALAIPVPEPDLDILDRAVQAGWPLGAETYLARIAHSTGRPAKPAARGRPPGVPKA